MRNSDLLLGGGLVLIFATGLVRLVNSCATLYSLEWLFVMLISMSVSDIGLYVSFQYHKMPMSMKIVP